MVHKHKIDKLDFNEINSFSLKDPNRSEKKKVIDQEKISAKQYLGSYLKYMKNS